jgi:DDE domain
VTLFRWVQRFTPLLVDAARPCRHRVGGHWFVDETYVKVSGSWRYVYRAATDIACAELAIPHLRPSTERRARTTPVAILAAAQNGTSDVLAPGKHVRR